MVIGRPKACFDQKAIYYVTQPCITTAYYATVQVEVTTHGEMSLLGRGQDSCSYKRTAVQQLHHVEHFLQPRDQMNKTTSPAPVRPSFMNWSIILKLTLR